MDNKLVIKNIFIRTIAEIAIGLRGLIVLPFISRSLGPEGFGVFSQIWLTVSLAVPILSLSIDNAIIRNISSNSESAPSLNTFWSGFIFASIFSLIVSLLPCFRGAQYLGKYIFGQGIWSKEVVLISMLIALGVPLSVGQSYFQGHGNYIFISLFQFLRLFGGAIVMCIAAIKGCDIFGIIISAFVIDALALITLLGIIIAQIGPPSFVIGCIVDMVKFGLPLAASNGLFILLNAIPRFYLVHLSGIKYVGIYAASFTLMALIGQTVSPMQFVLYPESMRLWKKGSYNKALNMISKGLIGFTCIASIVVIIGSSIGNILIGLLTTASFRSVPFLFLTIGLGVTFLGIFRLTSIYFMLVNRTHSIFCSLAISVALCLVSSYFIIPRMGLVGAGLAFLLSNVGLVIVALIFLKRMGIPVIKLSE